MKIWQLANQSIGVVKGTRLASQEEMASDPQTEQIDTWELVFLDRDSGDRIQIAFEREVRDDIVRQLTGGIVLAGGEFPRLQ